MSQLEEVPAAHPGHAGQITLLGWPEKTLVFPAQAGGGGQGQGGLGFFA